MSQKETNVWRQIILDAQALGFRLFRNQRYKGFSDKGAWLDCGVGSNGGSDLIGYRIITITPDMVGRTVAVFTAIEAKVKGGNKRLEQKQFIEAVEKNGGIALFATDIEQVKKYIDVQIKNT